MMYIHDRPYGVPTGDRPYDAHNGVSLLDVQTCDRPYENHTGDRPYGVILVIDLMVYKLVKDLLYVKMYKLEKFLMMSNFSETLWYTY